MNNLSSIQIKQNYGVPQLKEINLGRAVCRYVRSVFENYPRKDS